MKGKEGTEEREKLCVGKLMRAGNAKEWRAGRCNEGVRRRLNILAVLDEDLFCLEGELVSTQTDRHTNMTRFFLAHSYMRM